MNTIPEINEAVAKDRSLPPLGLPQSPQVVESVYWQRVFSGEDKRLQSLQRWFLKLPSAPRCGICCAPFGAWGSLVSRVARRQPATDALALCRQCVELVERNPGSARLEATSIIVNFRRQNSSKGAADRAPSDWERRFHRAACEVISRRDGIVDPALDGRLGAFFLPWRAGPEHADHAIRAARELFTVAKENALDQHGVQIAVGLHSGPAFIGAIQKRDGLDFCAVGPVVNTAGQLAAAATAGEALVSLAAWRLHGGPVAKSRRRTIPVPGALQPVEAVVVRGDIEAAL